MLLVFLFFASGLRGQTDSVYQRIKGDWILHDIISPGHFQLKADTLAETLNGQAGITIPAKMEIGQDTIYFSTYPRNKAITRSVFPYQIRMVTIPAFPTLYYLDVPHSVATDIFQTYLNGVIGIDEEDRLKIEIIDFNNSQVTYSRLK